jgi:predicted transcriptional regulator YdeE
MQPEIVQLPDRHILGSVARIEPMNADYVALWRNGFDPHESEVAALAVDPGYYGVYFGTDRPGWVDFVAGMVVGADVVAPEGLVLRPLPGGAYARFDCTLGTIGATWGAIYGQWLPTSGYAEDETRPALEYYPPGAMSPDAAVSIWVAIRPAG